eukprot:g4382.t1
MANFIEDDQTWYYKDNVDTTQGPFTSVKMQEFYERKQLPPDLIIANSPIGPWFKLSTLGEDPFQIKAAALSVEQLQEEVDRLENMKKQAVQGKAAPIEDRYPKGVPLSKVVKLQCMKLYKKNGRSDESDHLYWKRSDFQGKFHARKMAAQHPIPGSSVHSWHQRIDRRKELAKLLLGKQAEMRDKSTLHSKHNGYVNAEGQYYSDGSRVMRRLLDQVDGTSKSVINAHNIDPDTDVRCKVETVEILDFRPKDIELNDFKHNVIPKKTLDALEVRLWKSYLPPNKSDVMTLEELRGVGTPNLPVESLRKTRIITDYGGGLREANVRAMKTRKLRKQELAEQGLGPYGQADKIKDDAEWRRKQERRRRAAKMNTFDAEKYWEDHNFKKLGFIEDPWILLEGIANTPSSVEDLRVAPDRSWCYLPEEEAKSKKSVFENMSSKKKWSWLQYARNDDDSKRQEKKWSQK